MSNPPYLLTLLQAKTYVDDLTAEVAGANKRVVIMGLILTNNHHTRALLEALKAAAQRGVDVEIAIDAFTFGELAGHFTPFKHRKPAVRLVVHMAEELQEAGARFTWLGNKYKVNPFGGITHIKWVIVDDVVYSFGGTNLYKEGIESADFMFKSPADPTLAQQIIAQHFAIVESENSLAQPYQGFAANTPYGTLYIDNGQKRHSIIYDRVCQLSREASHVLMVTQYCPSGPLARSLLGKSDVYYNPASNASYPSNVLINYGKHSTGLHSHYSREPYLHAKFAIFTMPSGEKIAITGSHNFSYAGVLFGTREVALETDDVTIIEQLQTFFRTTVA